MPLTELGQITLQAINSNQTVEVDRLVTAEYWIFHWDAVKRSWYNALKTTVKLFEHWRTFNINFLIFPMTVRNTKIHSHVHLLTKWLWNELVSWFVYWSTSRFPSQSNIPRSSWLHCQLQIYSQEVTNEQKLLLDWFSKQLKWASTCYLAVWSKHTHCDPGNIAATRIPDMSTIGLRQLPTSSSNRGCAIIQWVNAVISHPSIWNGEQFTVTNFMSILMLL